VQVLLSQEEIRACVRRLAGRTMQFYQGRPVTILSVLTGSLVFLADFIRLLDLPLRIGVVQAASYRGAATHPGKLHLNTEFLPPIRDQEVLLLDDIFDSGQTLETMVAQLKREQPRDLRTLVLLRKQGTQTVALEPDECGFEIPDVFVVGYGLDYNGLHRHFPYIAALDEHDLR
jgi:hypoxanthine phosphoribosyltransferase